MALCLTVVTPAAAEERLLLDITSPEAFPIIEFRDADGKPTTSEQQKGHMTVLHFWATWCVPCVDELPEINEIQKKYEVLGLRVLPISMDGENNMKKVQHFLRSNKLEALQPYLDVGNKAFTAARIKGLPTTVFLNEKGEQIAVAEGRLDWLNPKVAGFLEFNLYQAKK